MFLDGKAGLHILDVGSSFSAATFLGSNVEIYGQSVEGTYTSFVQTFASMYTVYPNRLRADQGSVFTSDLWKKLKTIPVYSYVCPE